MTNKKIPQSHLYCPIKNILKIGFKEKKNTLAKSTYKHLELFAFKYHFHMLPTSVQNRYKWVLFENLFICHWLKISAQYNAWEAFIQITIPLQVKPEIHCEQTHKWVSKKPFICFIY